MKNTKLIQLSQNKNAYYPSPLIRKLTSNIIDVVPDYPDYKNTEINRKIADFFCVGDEYAAAANGSMEAIEIIPRICDTESVTIYNPTFWGYANAFQRFGIKFNNPDLDPQTGYSFEKINQDAKKSTLIFLCNPNNPTLDYLSRDTVEKLLVNNPNCRFVLDETMLIFDEKFKDKTATALVEKYNNLTVICSFSKIFGLAGIRAGAIISDAETIAEFKKSQTPYSIDSIKQYLLPQVLSDTKYLEESRKKISLNRAEMINSVKKTGAFDVTSENTNFIILKIKNGMRASYLEQQLLARNIEVRDITDAYPHMPGENIRVSVGDEPQIKAFACAVDDIVRKFDEKREKINLDILSFDKSKNLRKVQSPAKIKVPSISGKAFN